MWRLKIPFVIVVIGLLAMTSLFLTTPLVSATTQSAYVQTPSMIPTHPSTPVATPVSSAVNIYRLYSSEPAPMGIADFGIGSSGAYQYSTSSFLGIAQIQSLHTSNATGDPTMSMQLNVNLQFTAKSGQQYVYWIQDVAFLDTSNNQISFIDNIWNSSAPSASLSAIAVSGNGQVANCNCSTNNSFYYFVPSSSLPGNGITYSLPMTLQFEVNSTLNSQGQPQVTFAYNDGFGWQAYDTVTFLVSISSDSNFVVNGFNYNPANIYYDAELVLGGPGNGQDTSIVRSDLQLQLQYWNGHNYQGVTNAYNFGSDTSEALDNALVQWYYWLPNGSSISQVSPGSGSPGKLFYRSQIGVVSITSPYSSGTLYVVNASGTYSKGRGVPFVGGNVTVTVYPGNYIFYLYDSSGSLAAQYTETVTAGGYISLQVAPSSSVGMRMSYSSVGGSMPSAPTLTYFLNGQKITTLLTENSTTYYMDRGSTWSVNENISVANGEIWQTNGTSTGTATSSQSIDFAYYLQYSITFEFNVVSGGSGYGVPTVQFYQFGVSRLLLLDTPHVKWVDAGSNYTFSNRLIGSTGSERWVLSNSTVAGYANSPHQANASYLHQYYLVIESSAPSAGAVSPSSGWYNASSVITLSETSKAGWGEGGWVGSGSGSYTGSVSSPSIIVSSPITEKAVFLPGLTIVASNGGSVMYSYESVNGTVSQGNSKTLYLPPGTSVSLTPQPSFLYSFSSWTPSQTGTSLTVTVSSPVSMKAMFVLNFVVIGSVILVAILIVSSIALLSRRRHARSTPQV